MDLATNTQAIVATNAFDQTEGVEDSLIVVSFRGSVDAANLRTDLKSGMVSDPNSCRYHAIRWFVLTINTLCR